MVLASKGCATSQIVCAWSSCELHITSLLGKSLWCLPADSWRVIHEKIAWPTNSVIGIGHLSHGISAAWTCTGGLSLGKVIAMAGDWIACQHSSHTPLSDAGSHSLPAGSPAISMIAAQKTLVIGSTPLPAHIAGTASDGTTAMVAMATSQVASDTSDQSGCYTHHQHRSLHQRVSLFRIGRLAKGRTIGTIWVNRIAIGKTLTIALPRTTVSGTEVSNPQPCHEMHAILKEVPSSRGLAIAEHRNVAHQNVAHQNVAHRNVAHQNVAGTSMIRAAKRLSG